MKHEKDVWARLMAARKAFEESGDWDLWEQAASLWFTDLEERQEMCLCWECIAARPSRSMLHMKHGAELAQLAWKWRL